MRMRALPLPTPASARSGAPPGHAWRRTGWPAAAVRRSYDRSAAPQRCFGAPRRDRERRSEVADSGWTATHWGSVAYLARGAWGLRFDPLSAVHREWAKLTPISSYLGLLAGRAESTLNSPFFSLTSSRKLFVDDSDRLLLASPYASHSRAKITPVEFQHIVYFRPRLCDARPSAGRTIPRRSHCHAEP